MSSIFGSIGSLSIAGFKALVVASQFDDEEDVDEDSDGVSMIIGGFSSGIGEFFVDEMGLWNRMRLFG